MNLINSRKIHTIIIFSIIFTATVLAAWISLPVRSALQGEINFITNSTGATDSVRQISLSTNDIVFNPLDQTLYASVPSFAGSNGNSITRINPLTGETSAPVFVGSEPNHLALSGDGQSLYVTLEGSYAIRRYDTVTQTPGLQFPLGRDSFSGNYLANDIAVAPDNPNILAVARRFPNTSPPEAGVAIFDNGVQRPQTGPGHTEGSDFLAFSATGSTLYGTGFYSGLKTLTITANGVTVANSSSLAAGSRLRFDNGTIFTSSGQVIDAASRTLLGTFANAATSAFVSDKAAGRAYYLVKDSLPNTWILKAYDINTFVLIGTLTINDVAGDADALFRFGTNGLVFRTTANKIFFVQTSLIPTQNPLPTPSSTPTPSPTPTPAAIAVNTRQISLAANDLVYDQISQKIYASVSSNGGSSNGNTITAIDPLAGTIGGNVFVGSEPNKLALAGDGQTLYVALDGSGSVRKVEIPSLTAGPQFSTGSNGSYGPYYISDLAVAPDNPNLVAVPRQYIGVSPSQAGVAIFDNGVQRPQTGPGHSSGSFTVAFGETGSTLYGGGNSPGLSVMSVTGSGIGVGASFPFTGFRLKYSGGLVYGSNGQVINPANGAIAGTFQVLNNGAYSPFVIPDPANGRVFFLTSINSSWQIRAFDINTFLPLGTISLSGINTTPGGFARWGTNGLAISAGNQVYLIQTSLVNPNEPVPPQLPTPTPTPTPLPPTPPPTFVRRVNLPVNDLVFNDSAGTIYASVPSTAGVGLGNTISQVNPATGEINSSVFVGSEPGLLALADDGQSLYVKLNGANAFRRFNTATQTPEQQFTVNNFSYVEDMTVLPGNPQSLVLTHRYDGVAVYDNGVRRQNMSNGGAYSINRVEPSATAATLYGFCSESSGWDLVKFSVTSAGVSGVSRIGSLISGYSTDMKFAGGRLYATSGRVVDPETQTLLGTFQSGGSTVAVDTTLHRAFFLNNNVLTAYDTNTFIKIGSVTLPSFNGTPVSLVRWGANGLAFRLANTSSSTDNQLYLVQSALVSSNAPIPTGLQFSAASYFASESNQNVSVNVLRTGDLSAATTVDFATSDGTATAGADYTSVSGTLTFAPGESSRNFVIPIINDNIYEAPETINITLGNASTGTVVFPGTSVLTINDNDSRPFISVGNVTVNEPPPSGTGSAVFTVQLTNPTTQTVTVNYATGNGTATAGTDYTPANGTLTFNPLETSKSIAISLSGDGLIEPNETFVLSLSAAANASISAGQATATIRNYNSARRAKFDFDGDNKTDISIFRPDVGEWWYLRSSDGSNGALQFGLSTDKLTPGDFTGDGKTDIAFWRPSSGEWFILRSNDNSFYSVPFGAQGDIPAPSDYDGDGKTDLAVFRPSSGTWYILNSGNAGTSIIQFGISEDKPVTADYDGDGKSDIAIFRPSEGSWWYLQSSNLQFKVYTFGISTDKPVQGDYTGDGKADIAVFRPSTSEWFIQRSEDNSYFSYIWGQTGDTPTPGDYDGDGKIDASIFRSSSSTWYMNQTTAGVGIVTFGNASDLPVPNAFVP